MQPLVKEKDNSNIISGCHLNLVFPADVFLSVLFQLNFSLVVTCKNSVPLYAAKVTAFLIIVVTDCVK